MELTRRLLANDTYQPQDLVDYEFNYPKQQYGLMLNSFFQSAGENRTPEDIKAERLKYLEENRPLPDVSLSSLKTVAVNESEQKEVEMTEVDEDEVAQSMATDNETTEETKERMDSGQITPDELSKLLGERYGIVQSDESYGES